MTNGSTLIGMKSTSQSRYLKPGKPPKTLCWRGGRKEEMRMGCCCEHDFSDVEPVVCDWYDPDRIDPSHTEEIRWSPENLPPRLGGRIRDA